MSTFLLQAVTPGDSVKTLDGNCGAGGALQTSTNVLELQINQGAVVEGADGVMRQVTKGEVLELLEVFRQKISKGMDWPLAAK